MKRRRRKAFNYKRLFMQLIVKCPFFPQKISLSLVLEAVVHNNRLLRYHFDTQPWLTLGQTLTVCVMVDWFSPNQNLSSDLRYCTKRNMWTSGSCLESTLESTKQMGCHLSISHLNLHNSSLSIYRTHKTSEILKFYGDI